jgi:predicted site-specific integrase-resolvase
LAGIEAEQLDRHREDLAEDVLEIITVFSARLYGSRSRKKPKLLDGLKRAVEESRK